MLFYKFQARALLAVFFGLILSGCGGSSSAVDSGSGASADEDSGDTAIPSIVFSVSSTVVNAGDSVVVNWSSNRAETCQASGGWSGSKTLSGSETVGPLNQGTTLSLSCSGPGGGSVRSVDVAIGDFDSGPEVVITAVPEIVASGGTTTLSWSANGVSSCAAGGDWAGDRAPNGSEALGPLSEDTTYQLTCSGPSGNSVAMVTVRVSDKMLRWQAPSLNVDGTPVDDLAGYVIYWGRNSREYTGRQTISSPTTTQWEATMQTGEYYFALTAFDNDNNESGYSNEIYKLIP